ESLIAKLKRDIFKVDKSIAETDKLIAKSHSAPYLPDLQFRLAELYVEKSRYVYTLQAESRPEGSKGALISPETKLMKQKALQLYVRLQKEFPDFHDGDKVTFYLAHEERELGEFDEMLKTLGELIQKYPRSPLRLESEQILGDYYFDKADLVEAEKHYQAVLQAPPSPVHDLARYKMGWIRINQSKHGDAVPFFEAAAASPPVAGVDPQKSLNIKREALLDLVYSYTESRPAKGAINYFEKLSDSRSTFALALEKLGTRYFIKQEYEWAIPALRRLMDIQPDPELDLERAQKIYDSLKASKGQVLPRAEDIRYLVRSAVQAKTDPIKDEASRKKTLAELEEMSRDLATTLHTHAQKKDERQVYLDAAAAYREYLQLFRPQQYVIAIMKNRADALYAAKSFPEAARQFEELAQYSESKDPAGLDAAVYGALLAHYTGLRQENVDKLTAFEVADARQALKILGGKYLERFPQSKNVAEVKFNIARAHYDDGEYDTAGALFTAFALNNASYKDASVAGHLSLDALRQRNDFKGMEEAGNKMLASALPAAFKEEVKKILTQSRSEALGELAIKSAEATGDVVQGLLQVAEQNKGSEIGEKALYAAFTAARDKRDLAAQRDLGAKFIASYAKSQYLSDVLLTLGRQAAEAARFEEAAQWYEQVGERLSGDFAALDGWLAAARIRQALGQQREAIRDLEAAAPVGGARRAEVLAQLATAALKARDSARARSAAEQALKLDKYNSAAAAVLAETVAGNPNEKADQLIAVLTQVTKGPNAQSEETAKALWYLSEIVFRTFKALPPDQLDQKVAMLQQLEGVYAQTISMGSPEWAVASLWKAALAYQAVADVLGSIAGGLTGKEAEQYHALGKVYQDKTDSTFKTCLERAVRLEVFSTAVVGCRAKTESPKSPLPSGAGPGSAAAVDDLLKKVESKADAGSMEALGMAYLESRQLYLAQLALGRATELQDTRAS
ncbi:MAG TPA: hypothetical protein VFB81_04795, partial [Myxococcales bacterium]|nr:hypothetical protein [Myxococcales bacterium]